MAENESRESKDSKESDERRSSDGRRMDVVDRRLGLDRRRGAGRRLKDEQGDGEKGRMTDEQFDFLMAIDEYKRSNSRPFPTWTEVLDVIKALGYRKVAEPQSIDQSIEESQECRSSDGRRMDVVDRRLGLDRCRGPGRRLDDGRKAAEEGRMTDEQFDFLMAIDEYKRSNSRPFPTWAEVLNVIKALGYRKVAEPQSLDQPIEEDEEIKVPLGTRQD